MKRLTALLFVVAILLAACQAGSSATPSLLPDPIETAAPTPLSTPTAIPYQTPDWFQGQILYEIFVRSFCDSDGDGIGDLPGIEQKLDYLQSLHVDTLWLMPIHPSPSSHGYDVRDYFAVNPEFGTLEDLQSLVEAVHARGMHILIDFVPSHLSDQNPIFQDAYANPASRYRDWFVWRNDAHTLYAGFADSQEMPRFNHYNPEVLDYLSEAALFWLDLDGDGDTTDGLDGFRVDNATFPPQEFLVALRQRIKAANPQALLLGETWVNNPGDLGRFFPDQFDALFDFPLYQLLAGGQTFNGDGLLNAEGHPALLTILLNDEADFPTGAMPVRFLANHDTNRLATKVGSDPARLRLGAALLAALPGPIMIYYGEEIGMSGQKGGPPFWDNYRREPMDWYSLETGAGQTTWFTPDDRWNRPGDGISVEEQEADPGSLLNFYRFVFDRRVHSPALQSGTFTILELESSPPGGWGFVRQLETDWVICLYNFSDGTIEITIPAFPLTGGVLLDLLNGTDVPQAVSGESYTLTLPPSSAVWLAPPP
ncbi:MAG: alpha-glucosidase C-terminal domain-containing protein [Anaerolineales bacterium]|nr:alpha-glucosidase C-terminal domain-containing protein [Anaerolineales bacterium]